MNGAVVIPIVLTVAALGVYVALEGSRLIREALDELDARREWRAMCRRSDAARYLSNINPRSGL
jgi:hypothetical protein